MDRSRPSFLSKFSKLIKPKLNSREYSKDNNGKKNIQCKNYKHEHVRAWPSKFESGWMIGKSARVLLYGTRQNVMFCT